MIKILIFGSCVSRDILSDYIGADFELIDYYARSSLVSAFSKPLALEGSWSSDLSSNFQRKAIERDLNKSFSIDFIEKKYDVLLVDLIDERFNLWRDQEGRICTLSNELRSSGLILSNGVVIDADSEERFDLWKAAWDRFVEQLNSNNLIGKLIINNTYWTYGTEDGDDFSPSYKYDRIFKANKNLERLYQYIANTVPSTCFLTVSRRYRVGAKIHKWGVSPFHYVNNYYSCARDRLMSKEKSNSNPVIILTRFSMLMKSTMSAWRISKEQDIQSAMAGLFNDERLKARAKVFFEISLPVLDVVSRTSNVIHIVATSTYLPTWCKNKLEDAMKKYKWLRVVYYDIDDEFELQLLIESAINELVNIIDNTETTFAAIRLDDDDVLFESYFNLLSKYNIEKYENFCISMTSGFRGLFDGEKYVCYANEHIHNNAYGLAYIGRYSFVNKKFTTPYFFSPGTHLNVDIRVPTILDGTEPTYLRTLSQSSDGFSQGGEKSVYLESIDGIEKRHFAKKISFSVVNDCMTESVLLPNHDNLLALNQFIKTNDAAGVEIKKFLKEDCTVRKLNNLIVVSYSKSKLLNSGGMFAFYLLDGDKKITTTPYSLNAEFAFNPNDGDSLVSFFKTKDGVVFYEKMNIELISALIN